MADETKALGKGLTAVPGLQIGREGLSQRGREREREREQEKQNEREREREGESKS